MASTPTTTRRALALGGAIAAAGITAGAVECARPTPIMIAARRLASLNKAAAELDERGHDDVELNRQEIGLSDSIYESWPQTIADAAILLMLAAGDISGNDLYEDGTEGHERGEVVVRRVMHFLANAAGIDLLDCGGRSHLPYEGDPPLGGTVAEAAALFHRVDANEAARRHDEYRVMLQRQIILARQPTKDDRRLADLINKVAERWTNMPDDDPMLDAGRRLLARHGIATGQV